MSYKFSFAALKSSDTDSMASAGLPYNFLIYILSPRFLEGGFLNQLTPFFRATLSAFRICDEVNICVISISVVLLSRE